LGGSSLEIFRGGRSDPIGVESLYSGEGRGDQIVSVSLNSARHINSCSFHRRGVASSEGVIFEASLFFSAYIDMFSI